jgi:hypothetical protein
MKKLFCVFTFAVAIAAAALWGHAAEDIPVPGPEANPEQAYFPMQRSPRSVLRESAFLAAAAIDNFVDVTGWQNMDFDKTFFFAGGGGGDLSASFRGGGAGRVGAAYLGVYFSGDLFSGRGNAADKDHPTFAEAVNQSYNEVVMNGNFIVLFGNELPDGLRFDLCFDRATFTSLEIKDGNTESSATPFVTTLQWGRQFGGFAPKLSAGISWGGHGTDKEFDHPKLAFKAEAAYGNFGAEYQLSLAFDDARGGGADHRGSLCWTARTALAETLALEARPQLYCDMYACENTAESSGETIRNGELFYFSFAPALEAALQWQITPKILLATGVRFDLLRLESKTRGKGDAWTGDSGSSWSVAGAAATGGSLAFALSPSEHFTLEAGIDGIFDFTASEYKTDLTKLSGSFALIFAL